MSKPTSITILAAAIVLALAFLTNPSPEKHRAEIKEAIAERNQLAGVLGIGSLTAFISTYHTLGVASYTTVDEETVSIGAFGMVYVK